MAIKRNAVKCLKCDTVIESKHRHDFVSCKCGNIMADGGKDYIRRVGHGLSDKDSIQELSEFTKENEDISQ